MSSSLAYVPNGAVALFSALRAQDDSVLETQSGDALLVQSALSANGGQTTTAFMSGSSTVKPVASGGSSTVRFIA